METVYKLFLQAGILQQLFPNLWFWKFPNNDSHCSLQDLKLKVLVQLRVDLLKHQDLLFCCSEDQDFAAMY